MLAPHYAYPHAFCPFVTFYHKFIIAFPRPSHVSEKKSKMGWVRKREKMMVKVELVSSSLQMCLTKYSCL